MIKDTFTAQGLNWEEGLTIVKNVKSLRAEVELMTNGLDALQFDVDEEEKKLSSFESKIRQVKASINAFKKENVELKKNTCSILIGCGMKPPKFGNTKKNSISTKQNSKSTQKN